MVGPEIQRRVYVIAVVTLFLAWVFTPWLGLEALLHLFALVTCIYLGFVAAWAIGDWLRELREGREPRRGGVR